MSKKTKKLVTNQNKKSNQSEKVWTKPGFDPSKSYMEALKQFTETWQSMWKK